MGIMSIIFVIMFIFKNRMMLALGTLMGYEQYIDQFEGANTNTFTTLLLVLVVVVFWKHKIITQNNPKSIHYINALLLAFVLVPLTYVDPSAMRVVQYFSIFLMLLVPEIVKSFSKRDRTLVYYVAATLLVILYMKNNPQYLFFWQG
jgi:transmembrane protein EpsG